MRKEKRVNLLSVGGPADNTMSHRRHLLCTQRLGCAGTSMSLSTVRACPPLPGALGPQESSSVPPEKEKTWFQGTWSSAPEIPLTRHRSLGPSTSLLPDVTQTTKTCHLLTAAFLWGLKVLVSGKALNYHHLRRRSLTLQLCTTAAQSLLEYNFLEGRDRIFYMFLSLNKPNIKQMLNYSFKINKEWMSEERNIGL